MKQIYPSHLIFSVDPALTTSDHKVVKGMEWKKSIVVGIILPRGFVQTERSSPGRIKYISKASYHVYSSYFLFFVRCVSIEQIRVAKKFLTTDGHRLTWINTKDLKITRINSNESVSICVLYLCESVVFISGFYIRFFCRGNHYRAPKNYNRLLFCCQSFKNREEPLFIRYSFCFCAKREMGKGPCAENPVRYIEGQFSKPILARMVFFPSGRRKPPISL